MIQDPAVGSPLLVTFQGIEVRAIDVYHVSFTLKEAFTPFLSTLTVGMIPKHIWQDVTPERVTLHKANLQPVGTGPFKFAGFTKDSTGYISRYVLARSAEYYRQPAYLGEFVFDFFSSYEGQGGAVEAIREQKIDGVSFIPRDVKEQVERKHILIHTLQLPQYTALFFNREHGPILKEASMRTALEHALEKERVLREALNGEGAVIYSPILPGFPGYNPELPRLSYSLDEANTLLDTISNRVSAGEYRALRKAELVAQAEEEQKAMSSSTEALPYEPPVPLDGGASAIADEAARRDALIAAIDAKLDQELNPAQTFYRKEKAKDGDMFIVTLVTADTKEYRDAAELIAGSWQEVGVKTELTFVSPKDISRLALKSRDYDILLYGAIVGSDPDQYPLWHSSQIDFPGLNLARYVNRTADGFLVKAREAATEEEQIEAYQKFQEILLADRPAIFLYTPTYRYATTDKIQGINVARIFHPSDRFANVTYWYLNTDGQWRF